jgi:hypothetical protein
VQLVVGFATAVARVRSQIKICGIFGGQSGIRVDFFNYFGILCYHHHQPGADTTGQTMADVPSGLSLTPFQDIKKEPFSFL